MRKSNSVVGRVIVYTVNTGLVCGACEVLALVSALAWPENFVYVGFVMVLPKCNYKPLSYISKPKLTDLISSISISELYARYVSQPFSLKT